MAKTLRLCMGLKLGKDNRIFLFLGVLLVFSAASHANAFTDQTAYNNYVSVHSSDYQSHIPTIQYLGTGLTGPIASSTFTLAISNSDASSYPVYGRVFIEQCDNQGTTTNSTFFSTDRLKVVQCNNIQIFQQPGYHNLTASNSVVEFPTLSMSPVYPTGYNYNSNKYYYLLLFVNTQHSNNHSQNFDIYGTNSTVFAPSTWLESDPTLTVTGSTPFWQFVSSNLATTTQGTASPANVTINEPQPYGTTTASTTVPISIHYYLPATIDHTPDLIRTYVVSDAVTNQVEHIYEYDVGANAAENVTINQDIIMATGSKILSAYYATASGTPYTAPVDTFFNVQTNSYLAATGIDNPQANTATTTQISCTLYDVGCQFQKALVFLFYPDPTILNNIGSVWRQIGNVKPFAYITVTISQLQSLNMQGSEAFTYDMSNLPFRAAVFTPMRSGLASILWAIFLTFYFLKRLRYIEF